MNTPEDIVIQLVEEGPGHARLIQRNVSAIITNNRVRFKNGRDALDYLRSKEQASLRAD